jgi:hypothetical protein
MKREDGLGARLHRGSAPYSFEEILGTTFASLERGRGEHSTCGWRDELVREALDWLDRWLGPVASPASPAAR